MNSDRGIWDLQSGGGFRGHRDHETVEPPCPWDKMTSAAMPGHTMSPSSTRRAAETIPKVECQQQSHIGDEAVTADAVARRVAATDPTPITNKNSSTASVPEMDSTIPNHSARCLDTAACPGDV